MIILIVDIILFAVTVSAGVESGEILLSVLLGFFIVVCATMVLADAEYKTNTKSGREKLRREQEFEEKEWNEWRFMYQDKDK